MSNTTTCCPMLKKFQSIENHRLPVFSDVVLSLSGINDITRRTQISKLVTRLGGTCVMGFEPPVKATHLLCSGDNEPDGMRYAERFNEAAEARTHLVWEEWFWDSLDSGGRSDETNYQVSRPRPQRTMIPNGTHCISSEGKICIVDTSLQLLQLALRQTYPK